MTHSFNIIDSHLSTLNDGILAEKDGQRYVVSYAPAISQTVVVPVPEGADVYDPFDMYDIWGNADMTATAIYDDGPSHDVALERYETGVMDTLANGSEYTEPDTSIMDVLSKLGVPVEIADETYSFVKDLANYRNGKLYRRDSDGLELIVSHIEDPEETAVMPVLGGADAEQPLDVFFGAMGAGADAPAPQFFGGEVSHLEALSRYTGEVQESGSGPSLSW